MVLLIKFRYNILNEIENSSNTYDGNTLMTTMVLRYDSEPRWNIQVTGSYSRSTSQNKTIGGRKPIMSYARRTGEYEDELDRE